MARGAIPRTLPFIRHEAVKALKSSSGPGDLAIGEISRTLRNFYQRPAAAGAVRGTEVEKAVLATIDLYRRNVFPEMKVTFGTYANNIGHIDFPGCFRCHDDDHKTSQGKAIGQDCETCHQVE